MNSRLTVFFVSLMLPLFAQPVLNDASVLNANGYQNRLAPGVVFVIFGSGLGPAALASATAPNYPSSLGGTSVTFTPAAGGAPVTAKMVYSAAGQLAGLLPSSVAPGVFAVTVTFNGTTSLPQNVTVAPRSFGIATSNSGGNGAAQATIGNVNGGVSLTRLTTGTLDVLGRHWILRPSYPGDTLVLWGTGGGADLASDTGGTSGDQTLAGNFIVNVGGHPIVPVYAGASQGFPGLWQINFTLPLDIAPDCFAFVQVSAGSQLSNAAALPIAPAGQTSCSNPQISPSILSKLDSDGRVVVADFSVGQVSGTGTFPAASLLSQSIGGRFAEYSTTEWTLPFSGPKFGSCIVLDLSYPARGKDPSTPDSLLNGGSSLLLSGAGLSSGSAAPGVESSIGPSYNFTPALPKTLSLGAVYSMTGTGGSQVGSFTTSATLPSSFSVTNWDSLGSADRAKPLTVNWTGSGFDQVVIRVQGVSLLASTHSVTISCTVAATLGTYTIPPAALAFLPSVTSGTATGTGQISVTASASDGGTVSAASSTGTAFTPGLTGGGRVDFGSFSPFLTAQKSIAIQ